jgi:hypothetical protein
MGVAGNIEEQEDLVGMHVSFSGPLDGRNGKEGTTIGLMYI